MPHRSDSHGKRNPSYQLPASDRRGIRSGERMRPDRLRNSLAMPSTGFARTHKAQPEEVFQNTSITHVILRAYLGRYLRAKSLSTSQTDPKEQFLALSKRSMGLWLEMCGMGGEQVEAVTRRKLT
jgi:hypothetical protein